MKKLILPKLIAHRGASAYAPENTLAAIHTAADMDAAWVEIDVILTKDKVPVIFHDDTLERVTTADGNITDITYRELKQLDAGGWFSESFYGEPVPTLEHALDVIIDRDLGLNLEIKPFPGQEEETAEVALDILSRIWDEDDAHKLLISSFKPECLDVALHYMEGFHRGLLLAETRKDWEEVAQALQVSTINIANTPELANEFTVKAFKAKDYQVLAYTIDDLDEAEKLFEYGVDAIFSNMPDLLD